MKVCSCRVLSHSPKLILTIFQHNNEGQFSKDLFSCVCAGCKLFFVQHEEGSEIKLRTPDETLRRTDYVTRRSWSLEKLFCKRGGLSSLIPITRGDGISITESQVNSNIACNILGSIIILLLLTSFLYWHHPPREVLGIVIFLAAIFSVWLMFTTYRLWIIREDIVNKRSYYRYLEVYQFSEPKDGTVWLAFIIEFLCLWLLPLIYLCIDNWPMAL